MLLRGPRRTRIKLKSAFDENSSGFQRTIPNLLPAFLDICYQHHQDCSWIFQSLVLDTKQLVLGSLEPRGFEPLTSSMPLRRSTN
jgi:hypothetical protein